MQGWRETPVACTMWTAVKRLAAVAAVSLVAGCAADGYNYGDPGARPLASGESCGSIRAELDRLDKKGTQAKVEQASQGKKLAPAAQAEVDRYNSLLNQYLGARCHV